MSRVSSRARSITSAWSWHDLTIDPAPAAIRERIDYFGNHVSQFAILAPYTEMRVLSRSEVELQAPAYEVDPAMSPPWESVRESLLYSGGARVSGRVRVQLSVAVCARGRGTRTRSRADLFEPGRPILAAPIDLMHEIHDGFTFDPAATSVATPVTAGARRSGAASARTSRTCSSRRFDRSGCPRAT